VILEKLLKFSLTKEDGGARTPNQLHLVYNMISYVFTLKGEHFVTENQEENNKNLETIFSQIKSILKSNEETKKPNHTVFHQIFNYTHRILSLFFAKNISFEENIKENLKKMLENFETICSKFKELKKINPKIQELKNKLSLK